MSAQRLFVAIGLCAAVLFAFVTPPFQVPDEVGHFWRAASIAQGTILPRIDGSGAVASIPNGLAILVQLFYRSTAGAPNQKIVWEQFRSSKDVRLEPQRLVSVRFPAGYTPVPYLPQIVAALIGRLFDAWPVVTFYLGRLFNAIAYVAVVAMAIRITPVLGWLFAAAALLPMAMFLAASWSPDAMTIAAAFLFTAALLRGVRNSRDVALLATVGALVGLCKPAYFLIALLALAIPAARGTSRAIIIAATAAGVALAMGNAARAFVVPERLGVRIDARAQIDCLRHHPAQFAEALGHEARLRGAEYAEQAVGRLGLLDVWLPRGVFWAELLLLVLCAWRVAPPIPAARPPAGLPAPHIRVAALLISVVTIAGVALSAYLGWTTPCATSIEGIQGRYFLPIVPLVFLIISAPLIRRDDIPGIALMAVAIIANGAGLVAVAARYY